MFDEIDESMWTNDVRVQYDFPLDGVCPKCGKELLNEEEGVHCYSCGLYLYDCVPEEEMEE